MNTTELIREYENLTLEAVSEYNRKDYEKALKKFEKMAEANPNNPKIFEILVRLYIVRGDIDAAHNALATWKSLMEKLFPGMEEIPRRSLDELAAEAESEPELENRCREILDRPKIDDPFTDLDAISKLGIVLMARGKYKEAERILSAFREKIG